MAKGPVCLGYSLAVFRYRHFMSQVRTRGAPGLKGVDAGSASKVGPHEPGRVVAKPVGPLCAIARIQRATAHW